VISKFSINMNTDELRSSSSSIDKKHTEKIKSPARLHLSLAHKRDTNKKTKTPPDLEREVANLKKKETSAPTRVDLVGPHGWRPLRSHTSRDRQRYHYPRIQKTTSRI